MTNRSITLNALVQAQQQKGAHDRPVLEDAFEASGLSVLAFSSTVNQLMLEQNVWEFTPNVNEDWTLSEFALTVDMMQRVVSFQRPVEVQEERADGSIVSPVEPDETAANLEAADEVFDKLNPEPNLDPPQTPPTKRGRLNESDVRQILNWRQGGETIASLASKYEVSTTCISNIVNGKTWKNIKGE